METSNALDLLVLPIILGTAGTVAAFALIRLARVALGWLLGAAHRPAAVPIAATSARPATRRPASPMVGSR